MKSVCIKISILASNIERLINRVIILLNRSNFRMIYLNIYDAKKQYIMRYTLEVKCTEVSIDKIAKQIEKHLGIISILYY
ncbi:hypothetical protein [Candidatus Walczuchella endosymbiont of Icerya purchasi]|uniref:hypothetical protein n=1 Tax=Candidatus Walczuchella endosymbiont of Icerya purchasi TaxID=3066219 RepID=UPI00313EC6B6